MNQYEALKKFRGNLEEFYLLAEKYSDKALLRSCRTLLNKVTKEINEIEDGFLQFHANNFELAEDDLEKMATKWQEEHLFDPFKEKELV